MGSQFLKKNNDCNLKYLNVYIAYSYIIFAPQIIIALEVITHLCL